MNKRMFVLAAALVAATPVIAAQEPADGLVARSSRNLDHVRTAASWPAAYRSVLIPPIEVEFGKLGDANAIQRPGSRPSNADIRRASQDMARSLRASLQGALQRAGYDIATAPAPGVLVLKTSLEDVRVNAPQEGVYGGAGQKTYVREAGEARLRIDGYDGATNQKVLSIEDLGRPRAHMPGVDRADPVTNRFWFEDLFDRWADGVVRELPGAGRTG